MLCVFGKGRLGMAPEKKVDNASGAYYKVRIAINRTVRKKNGEFEPEVLWCNGLVHENKLTYQLKHMTKGANVTFLANRGWINQWESNKTGKIMADIDLGFLTSIETSFESEANGGQAQAPAAPQVQAPAQAAMPAPAHVYAPAPAQAPTQVWDGKKWVPAPPQQSIGGPAPAPAPSSNLPF